jgi:membrane protease YdiL (CAAX protease family)
VLRHVRERRVRHRTEVAKNRRAVRAVAAIYAGTLLVVVGMIAALREGLDPDVASLASHALFALCGVVGIAILGRGVWRETLAARPRPLAVVLGIGTGLVIFAVATGYVLLLDAIVPASEPLDLEGPILLLLLDIAVLPALIEEWVDRGVLWFACRRVGSVRMTILVTATLFALTHGVAWGFLGLPHRFVMGLILGWLRHRTGSLVPGIAAHFVNNALAVAVA